MLSAPLHLPQALLRFSLLALLASALPSMAPAQVSLYSAVDLALRNSNAVHMAEADVRKAEGVVTELRDAYIPNLTVGSGLGYSYGFTVNPPTLYNITSQALLFSFSQKDYIRSARSGLEGARMQLQDVRDQVILDTAQTYLELSALESSLAALKEESDFTDRLTTIVRDRFGAGLESKIDLTRVRLSGATLSLKQVQMRGRVDELRDHLARLTGLPASSLAAKPASIPQLRSAPPERSSDTSATPVVSAAVASAQANAQAKEFQAVAVHHEEYRPTVGLASEYQRYSTLTNYQQYFTNFKPNNFGFGLQITWPLFDQTRRAKAMQASADAAHARAEYQQAKTQAAEQTLKLQHTLEELAAQQQVAELTDELALDNLNATLTQLNASAAGGTPLTPKDEQNARIEERQRYIDLLEAKLALAKVELAVLRATGAIENWARSQPEQ